MIKIWGSPSGGHYLTVTTTTGLAIVLLAAVNLLIAGSFTFYGTFVSDLNARRRSMLQELASAYAHLSETMAENTELHAKLVARSREAGVLDVRTRMAGRA
ncbi:hypothetical protein [Pseudonocardia sp. GCM10023141]|uniref:hypothetical protein n=1 Tax=Pseudonocardia sp. GCM10023141 TaxID=3252653 RepID=UPI003613CAEE